MPRRHTRRRAGALDPEPPQRDNDPTHNAAPVRRAQRLEIEGRRLAGISVNNRLDANSELGELSARLRRLREEPMPIVPDIGHAPADGHLMSPPVPRRIDFGGKRRKYRKTKKSTRRHRRR